MDFKHFSQGSHSHRGHSSCPSAALPGHSPVRTQIGSGSHSTRAPSSSFSRGFTSKGQETQGWPGEATQPGQKRGAQRQAWGTFNFPTLPRGGCVPAAAPESALPTLHCFMDSFLRLFNIKTHTHTLPYTYLYVHTDTYVYTH